MYVCTVWLITELKKRDVKKSAPIFATPAKAVTKEYVHFQSLHSKNQEDHGNKQ